MSVLRTAGAVTAALVLSGLSGCATGPSGPALPTTERARDDLIRSAQQVLVSRCLADQGLSTTGPRPASPAEGRRLQAALFGTGPAELSLTLHGGHTVSAHTDGCLASAQRALYGDQRRWFRAQVTYNNVRTEAGARMRTDPAHRAALARFTRCTASSTAGHCARESGLADVEARLEPARLAEVRALRRDQLDAYTRLRTRALHRAAELSSAHLQRNTTEKGFPTP
ncbi:hypothetical protein OHA27_24710 [Streptomyces sp. NBC_01619]|uniref:hypothetical protein n=1 Tax=Streptomyces sp. NBC_01619 TaxID=2975901 RepID=UPI00225A36FA|nr:hypothetical protein [Streptomyces sp. NBC_01619]MCX4513466.1 hypothetical protein [Streptomyces sp. NBC_01619]